VTGAGQVIEEGTLVLEHGLITAVGASVKVPDGVWVIDGSGKVVYPGLVDALSDIALEKSEATGDAPFWQGLLDRPGTTSWTAAADALVLDDDRIEAWRNAGFTSTVSSPTTGIVSGQAAFLNLGGGARRGSRRCHTRGSQSELRTECESQFSRLAHGRFGLH
jgi:imidazolonepropionase-like amidohydrolase